MGEDVVVAVAVDVGVGEGEGLAKPYKYPSPHVTYTAESAPMAGEPLADPPVTYAHNSAPLLALTPTTLPSLFPAYTIPLPPIAGVVM